MKKLQLRLLSVLCLAALLIACLPAAYAYGVCSAWAKPELDQMSELSLIPQALEELRGMSAEEQEKPHVPRVNAAYQEQ